MIFKNLFLIFFLFIYGINQSQEISGVVFESETGVPLEGASIYFDNTTIGTTTNSKGEFVVKYHKEIKSPLIISFIGYKTKILNNVSPEDSGLEIYLIESTDFLNEIVLNSKDDWTRELKLNEFKKNYLGESKNGLASKILNEDDLILRYNKRKKQLIAESKAPIIIKNNNLKYIINVDLQHFEVNYSHVSKNKKNLYVRYVYYAGNNFYKSMQLNPNKITQSNRMGAYYGSTLHFMRALASEKLEKERYRIYLGNYPVWPKKYITVIQIDGLNNVKVRLKDKLNIVYKGEKQSSLECLVSEFYIDNFGNHSPTEEVRFGGDLGAQRMGDALPLDFLIMQTSINFDI